MKLISSLIAICLINTGSVVCGESWKCYGVRSLTERVSLLQLTHELDEYIPHVGHAKEMFRKEKNQKQQEEKHA